MHRFLFLVSLVVGCGGMDEACLDYTNAYQACIDEADAAGLDVDVETSDPEGFCDGFAETSDETWDCLGTAYNSSDCTTDAGLAEALAEADACGPVE